MSQELQTQIEELKKDVELYKKLYAETHARAEEAETTLSYLHTKLKPYFTSGNSIEVERAIVPKSIFDSLALNYMPNSKFLL